MNALSTSGLCEMPCTPSAPSATNQVTMIGPNSLPIFSVPCFCTRNSATSTTSEIGTTQWSMPSKASPMPSTADSTDTAGVIMLSP
ncbi:hypothetical protein D3C75_776920 [compost metagenome]